MTFLQDWGLGERGRKLEKKEEKKGLGGCNL